MRHTLETPATSCVRFTASQRSLALGVSALVAFSACGGGADSTVAPPTTAAVATVELTPGSASLTVQASTTLSAIPRDAAGNAIAGRTVAWSSENPSIATVNNGLVTGVSAGTVRISATVDGRSGSSAITVAPLTPATMTVVTGDGQTGTPLSALPIQPIVEVRDAAARPVAGVSVAFTIDSGGGSVQFATVLTGADGRATPGNWTLGMTEGRHVLRASTSAISGIGTVTTATVSASAVTVAASLITAAMTPNGGTITISAPHSPLHQVQILVPSGALSETKTFVVSTKSALQTPLPSGATLATPSLVIDANAVTLSQPLLIRLPRAADSTRTRIALARNALGELRVLPTVGSSASGMTVALGDLGGVAPSEPEIRGAFASTPIELLWVDVNTVQFAGDVETLFRPGVDDWDFARQVVTAPVGATVTQVDPAASMVATALWYFAKRKAGDGKLWQRFQEARGIGESNRSGLRWVGLRAPLYQAYYVQSLASDSVQAAIVASPARAASLQLVMIRLAMAALHPATPRPVPILLISDTAASAPRIGIAYRTVGDAVEIAVPEQPSRVIRVQFTPAGMTPFVVTAHNGAQFTVTGIALAELPTKAMDDALAAQFPKVANGTIGKTEKWPATDLRGPKDSGGLVDLSSSDRVVMRPYPHWWRCLTCPASGYVATNVPNDTKTLLYRSSEMSSFGTFSPLSSTSYSAATYSAADMDPELESTWGFALYQPGPGSTVGIARGQSWVDWRTIKYRRLPVVIAPQLVEASKDTTVTFSATVQNVPAGAKYEWKLITPIDTSSTITSTASHTQFLTVAGDSKMVVFVRDSVTGWAIGTDTSDIALNKPKVWRIETFAQTSLTNTFPANHQPAAPTWETARTSNELRDSILARPTGARITLFRAGDARPNGYQRVDDPFHYRAETSANGASVFLTYPRGLATLTEAMGATGAGSSTALPAGNYPFVFTNTFTQTGSSTIAYAGRAANWVHRYSLLLGNACGVGNTAGSPSSLARSIIEFSGVSTGQTMTGTITFVTQAAAIEIQALPTVCLWEPMAVIRRTFAFTAVRVP